jgi:uncharacterized membrane protein YeaQ/YmgE (transglycosylase-associated protein family)
MTVSGFLLLLLIAGVCGSLAQALTGYSRGGCLVSIVLGFVGAIVGTWIAHAMGLEEILAIQVGGRSFPIVWSIIGAALFVALLNVLSPRQRV